HASDHFALAVFACMVFGKNKRWVWFAAIVWAAAIAYAQVYVGVHYPLDVLAGAALGTLIGWLYGLIYYRYFKIS
ncbi:MAG: phosphatase PAP2 family protein, partial [Sphingobacteriaceae bacterium]